MTEKMIRLDLGCGKNKRNDGEWIGVDSRQFTDKEGKELVDQVVDLTVFPWPWDDNSVDEVHASHFVEHLTAEQRVKFINELHRILKPDGLFFATCPSGRSMWAWGDPSHTRVITSGTLSFLSQRQYAEQVGKTPMSDFRHIYKADFEPMYVHEDENYLGFVLRANK